MNNELLREQGEAEYHPEEAALLMRLRVSVNMAASQLFHINFPTLPVYIMRAHA